MGHNISGLIARIETFKRLDGALAGQPLFHLKQGFAFLPLDYENLDAIVGLGAGSAIGEFCYLTEPLIELLRSQSRHDALAYVETDYFGGAGGQGAMAFCDGAIVFGPAFSEGGPINDALAQIGAERGAACDLFEAIGLDDHRANDDFRDGGKSA